MSAVATAADPKLLLRQDANGITTLTLNRPNQYNALSEELLSDLQSALDAIGKDEAVRVVVIAGSGPAFCAGADLTARDMKSAQPLDLGAMLDKVEREDESVVEAVQRGMSSRLYESGRYSPKQERGVHHFHRLLADAING
jgi:enoyl-CoA hydratase/carnithine racemase